MMTEIPEPVPLWEVGARAIADHRDDAGGGWEHPDDIWRIYTPFAEWVIAAVEPLIRAEERERIYANLTEQGYVPVSMVEEQQILLDGWIAERKRLQHIITELIRNAVRGERERIYNEVRDLLMNMHSDWNNPRYQAVLDLIIEGDE